eukprot:1983326-Pyramimonas_sp.AAC.1
MSQLRQYDAITRELSLPPRGNNSDNSILQTPRARGEPLIRNSHECINGSSLLPGRGQSGEQNGADDAGGRGHQDGDLVAARLVKQRARHKRPRKRPQT